MTYPLPPHPDTLNRVYAFTVTRANTPERARMLLNTLTQGRETCGYDQLYWHVYAPDNTLASDVVKSAFATKVVDEVTLYPHNKGQHVPFNDALQRADSLKYRYLLRVDDDVEWLTKRWLAKLVAAMQTLGDKPILAPSVRGLRFTPPRSDLVMIDDVPVRFTSILGGICRLHPTQLLFDKGYVSDVRRAMGAGDATYIEEWCDTHDIDRVVVTSVRVRHAHGTDEQEVLDPLHFTTHSLLQRVPYVPPMEAL